VLKELQDPKRGVRLLAAENLRDHHPAKALEVLPVVIDALGEEIDQAPPPNMGREYLLASTLYSVANAAGPARVKVIRNALHDKEPRHRAAAFRLLYWVSQDKPPGVGHDELLAKAKQGLKYDSALVRLEASWPLQAFYDAPNDVAGQAVALLTAALSDTIQPRPGILSPAAHAAFILMGYKARAKPALSQAAETPEKGMVAGACSEFASIAKHDETVGADVANVFRRLLNDKTRPDFRWEGAVGLQAIGPEAARDAVKDLADVLDEMDPPRDLRMSVYTTLRVLELRSVPAVTGLIAWLQKTTERREKVSICRTLKAIGPGAVQALTALEKLVSTDDLNSSERDAALEAIAAINKK
jgi:HEAT repeat protein